MWTRHGPIRRRGAAAFLAVVIWVLLAAGCGGDSAPSADREAVQTPAAAPEPPRQAAVSPAELFPEGSGRALVLNNCASCHAIACSAIGQRTAARWDSLKQDHRDKVGDLSEADLETIFAYLKEHFSDSKPEPVVPADFLAGGCTPF